MSDQDLTANQIAGLNRKIGELSKENQALTQRLADLKEPDELLRQVEARATKAELRIHLANLCHESGLPVELFDGYDLSTEQAVNEKVIQVAATLHARTTEGINAQLASGKKPGSGNVEIEDAPDLDNMTTAQLRAYHIKEQQRLLDAKRPPTPAY